MRTTYRYKTTENVELLSFFFFVLTFVFFNHKKSDRTEKKHIWEKPVWLVACFSKPWRWKSTQVSRDRIYIYIHAVQIKLSVNQRLLLYSSTIENQYRRPRSFGIDDATRVKSFLRQRKIYFFFWIRYDNKIWNVSKYICEC